MARARVLLLGDSMRLSFQARLGTILSEDGLEVVGPPESCGGVAALSAGVEGWASDFQPDMACFGCGPWATEDLARVVATGDVAGFEPVFLGDFERGLINTVDVLRRWCGRQVVYYSTSPVNPERVGAISGDADFGLRVNRWIAEYDEVAMGLLGELNVGAADLHRQLARHDDEGFEGDGIGLTAAGVEWAARVLAKGIYGIVRP